MFDEIVPPELRESVFVSDRAIPAFTTKFNQNQPPEQKEKGIDKLNSMSLSEKMLLRQNDIGQYNKLAMINRTNSKLSGFELTKNNLRTQIKYAGRII